MSNGNAPLVSIVTPAYNAASVLGQTIESVQAQSFSNWEMIIVDDVSMDGTIALAERYALKDDRIRIIRRAENGGPAAARNKGMEAAHGRYIAFLDADDLWLPHKLERQLAFMDDMNAAISCTAYRRFVTPESPGRLIRCPRRITFDTLLRKTCVATLTTIIDRDKTGPVAFSEDVAGYEDLALWLTLTRSGHDIVCLNEDLARYRIMPNSQSSKWLRSLWWTWRVYRDVANLPRGQAALALLSYGFFAALKRVF